MPGDNEKDNDVTPSAPRIAAVTCKSVHKYTVGHTSSTDMQPVLWGSHMFGACSKGVEEV